MKLKIFISSSKCEQYNIKNLLKLFNLSCQIYKTVSSNPSSSSSSDKYCIEDGYCIIFFEITQERVKVVWYTIQRELNTKCAFVVSDQYKGCILNWPGIFRSSVCSKL
jgi:hypothetical protein